MKYRGLVIANIALILLWEGASLVMDKPFLPTPLESFASFFHMVFYGNLTFHFMISLLRVLGGIAMATIFALPVGIAMGYSKKVDSFFSPVVTILYPLPKIVFLPILVVFLGLGNLPKILLLFIILFFQLVVSIRDIVKKVPQESYLSIYSLTQSFWDILVHLIFPWALPDFLTAIRISIGTSIAVLFFVETFASFNGLGYLILNGMERREYPEMYAGIIGMALLGLILYFCVHILEKKYCSWKLGLEKERTRL